MIKLENVTLLTTKGDSEAINFVAENKVNYLDATDKNLFKVLSIKQQYIKDGVMSIDDFSLFPLKDQRKYAFVLAINSAVITLNAVFVFELSFKDKSRTILKHDLTTLREMALEDPENKIAKIDAIFDMLKKHNVAYVLVDGNDPINKENRLLINETLDKLQDICVLFLRPTVKMSEAVINEEFNLDDTPTPVVTPIVTVANKKEDTVKDKEDVKDISETIVDNSNDETISDDEDDLLVANEDNDEELITPEEAKQNQNEKGELDYEKEFSKFDLPSQYAISEEAFTKDVEANSKVSFKNRFLKNKVALYINTMFKNLYLYYLFNGLFSIFLGVCSFSSIYLIKSGNSLIAGILIFLDIIFVFMHLYILGSTYAGLKTKLPNIWEKVGFILLFILFTILGLGIGFLFIFVLSINKVFVDLTLYVTADWSLGIVVSIIAILAPIAVEPLSIAYVKLAKLVAKYLPKKADE